MDRQAEDRVEHWHSLGCSLAAGRGPADLTRPVARSSQTVRPPTWSRVHASVRACRRMTTTCGWRTCSPTPPTRSRWSASWRRPARRDQARPHPGQRRRHGGRGADPLAAAARPAPATPWSARSSSRTGHGPRRWIVDPIDGTKNYVRGVPVWATLIALVDDEVPVVGSSPPPRSAAAGGRRRGTGAWTGRTLSAARRLHVSEVGRVEDASLSYAELRGWEESGRLEGFLPPPAPVLAHPRVRRLLVLHARRRGRGRHRRRAPARPARHGGTGAGRAPRPAAGSPRWTGVDGPWGGSAVATNGLLHDSVIELLARDGSPGHREV